MPSPTRHHNGSPFRDANARQTESQSTPSPVHPMNAEDSGGLLFAAGIVQAGAGPAPQGPVQDLGGLVLAPPLHPRANGVEIVGNGGIAEDGHLLGNLAPVQQAPAPITEIPLQENADNPGDFLILYKDGRDVRKKKVSEFKDVWEFSDAIDNFDRYEVGGIAFHELQLDDARRAYQTILANQLNKWDSYLFNQVRNTKNQVAAAVDDYRQSDNPFVWGVSNLVHYLTHSPGTPGSTTGVTEHQTANANQWEYGIQVVSGLNLVASHFTSSIPGLKSVLSALNAGRILYTVNNINVPSDGVNAGVVNAVKHVLEALKRRSMGQGGSAVAGGIGGAIGGVAPVPGSTLAAGIGASTLANSALERVDRFFTGYSIDEQLEAALRTIEHVLGNPHQFQNLAPGTVPALDEEARYVLKVLAELGVPSAVRVSANIYADLKGYLGV